jgi:hypothetical protein
MVSVQNWLLVAYNRSIRFDIRDMGLSTYFTNASIPDLVAAQAGDYSSVSYTLFDIAADTIGLSDLGKRNIKSMRKYD